MIWRKVIAQLSSRYRARRRLERIAQAAAEGEFWTVLGCYVATTNAEHAKHVLCTYRRHRKDADRARLSLKQFSRMCGADWRLVEAELVNELKKRGEQL